MTWIKQYAEKRSAKDPEFKAAYEEEAALLGLVRARKMANLTQQNLAKTLRVSQPYIAQIERGSKPMSVSFFGALRQRCGRNHSNCTPTRERTPRLAAPRRKHGGTGAIRRVEVHVLPGLSIETGGTASKGKLSLFPDTVATRLYTSTTMLS